MYRITLIALGLFWTQFLFGPPTRYAIETPVDRQFDSMTVNERIAQLFMIEVRPTYGAAHLNQVEQILKTHQVGGVIFFKGDPVQQAQLTNQYQALSKVPLLVAIDGEWGLSMRLSNTISYPYQLALGAIRNDSLIYRMGQEIGRQCKRIGVHVNFAPVIDVNNNPNNPVINYRSFGEVPQNVARKGWAYASGMQDAGIIACAKHFPGHGDTDVDSHKDLPVITHSMERLNLVEFVPFRYLIDQGVESVMTAHLYIPAIDDRPNTAVSVSDKAINGLLRQQMGFKGLAFTDALNMKGVAKYHAPGELELKALMAGNDILLAPGDIPKAIELIKKSMVVGQLSQEYVWGKVKKILTYKRMLGLDSLQQVETKGLIADLNSHSAKRIQQELVEASLCLVRDKQGLLPLERGTQRKVASVSIGATSRTTFQEHLQRYLPMDHFQIAKNASEASFSQLLLELKGYDLLVVGLHNTSKYPPGYGITNASVSFVNKLAQLSKTMLVHFGNPYSLGKLGEQDGVLLAYEDEEVHQQQAAKALFGLQHVNGRLPISIGPYKRGQGVDLMAKSRLDKALPEDVGMRSSILNEIDRITERAVRIGATPGAQVLVAKNGHIVYQKSFGRQTYSNGPEVNNEDLYDLASITKVAATTLSLMKLYEQGRISLDDRMAKYLPELEKTNKSYLTIREVLEHKAGLKAWIPFYQSTTADRHIYDSIYEGHPTATHNVHVGNGLYMLDSYKDRIFQEIYESELEVRGNYKYSDLGMILMKELIERVTEMPFDAFVEETFYVPLGLERLTFLPLNKFSEEQVVPSALSPDMRKGTVRGYVHDPAAAMLGGISGHAGLFGNSESLAILMQMLLNGGVFNGKRILNEETIHEFTKQQSRDSRRGLGWDKPEFKARYRNPASDYASRECFGHTGFTGTMVWVDPKYDLIYVFLSNRVYPTQENKKLLREGVRTEIMDVIYKSFLDA